MYIIYSPRHEGHSSPYELHFGRQVPPAEVPDRMCGTVRELRAAGIGPILEPRSYPLERITAVHDGDYLEYLRTALQTPLTDPESDGQPATALFPSIWPYSDRWPVRARTVMAQVGYYCFDTYTPIVSGTYEAAILSAECALTGADLLREGEQVAFALCRPPGHHAMRRMCGGYCYLNNAAIAAQYLSSDGQVAILDVDYHHGNGTQSIFYDTDRVLYVSIHADPENAYPYYSGCADERGEGKGLGFNLNLPLPSGTTDEQYSQSLEQALAAVHDFTPAYLIVSLGFDTCRNDPICDFQLSPEFFGYMAERIAALDVPSLIIAEGGYNVERLGHLAVDFLQSWQSPSARG